MLKFITEKEDASLRFNNCKLGLYLEINDYEMESLAIPNIIIEDIPSLIQLRNEIDFSIENINNNL